MKNAKILFVVFLIFIFSFAATAFLSHDTEETWDILFTNGRVLDGTGNPCFYADVGIKDDKIVAVGRLQGKLAAEKVIDISGKIISPGFIDMHTHAYDRVEDGSTWVGEDTKRFCAPNFVSQGVTTLVSNMCGGGPIDIQKQRETLTENGIGLNVALFIGHNAVRRHVMTGDFRRPATTEEIIQMKKFVHKAMEEGAFGMSTGLEYVPSIWSTEDEVVALVEEITPYGGVYMAHERASGLTPMWYVPSQDEPGPPNMLGNIVELINVGKRTGATVMASHIKARGVDFWGGSRAIIRLIDEARAQGVDIWADCYPYNSSGSDGRTVLIPRWALGENFQQDLKKVLEDPEKAKDLYGDIEHNLNWRGEAKNIIVMDHPDKSLIGKSLDQIAIEQRVSDVEMVIKLQMEGYTKMPGGARLRGFSMSEIDIEAFSAKRWTATSSDASIALPGDGPVHARFYGTFPRKIRHYALERNVITLEDAVRASTSLPAQILGLRDRGMIREGFHADVVVFDPENIKDKATFFEPHQHAEGISYVLVNGVYVVDDGKLTWEKPGKVLANK
ncbi:MAG: amidohydrolase family protein [Candidatus Aminicenantes bacterium]|nr:MAG: amidohydrolase family protein [Candidatus Aminicenantes bacterium]